MQRIFWFSLFLWTAYAGSTAIAAINGCTAEDVSKLKRDGWSVEEIRSLCENSPVNESTTRQVQVGQRCATKLGVCNLFNIEPAPLGTPCYCNNPNTGQADHGQIIH